MLQTLLSGVLASTVSLVGTGAGQVPQIPSSRWTAEAFEPGSFDRSKFWGEIKAVWKLPHGVVFLANDQTNLYILVDLGADFGDDSNTQGGTQNDGIELVFDVDRNGQVTPGVDISYLARAGLNEILKAVAEGPKRKGHLVKTSARFRAEFGPSPTLKSLHRRWEISIPLSELSAEPGSELRMGFRTWSSNPQFNDSRPENLENDFSQLLAVRLATGMISPIGGGEGPKSPSGPASPVVTRTILPDGRVQLTRPDGSRKIFNGCGTTQISSTGHQSTYSCAEAQPPNPPPLPSDPDAQKWLRNENDTLLSIIKSLVGNDQQAIQNYLNSEGSNLTDYERIGRRTTIINQLLSAN